VIKLLSQTFGKTDVNHQKPMLLEIHSHPSIFMAGLNNALSHFPWCTSESFA